MEKGFEIGREAIEGIGTENFGTEKKDVKGCFNKRKGNCMNRMCCQEEEEQCTDLSCV